jgi:hypothetical protein
LRRKTGSAVWWNRAAQVPRGVGSGDGSDMVLLLCMSRRGTRIPADPQHDPAHVAFPDRRCSMTDEAKELFLADRVRALVAVILTRRDDLTIAETKQGTGLDLHVYIDREDKPMRLAFGVLLRGVSSAMTADNANKVLGPTVGKFQGMRKFTYPVCLFFFTMRDEKACFSWLAEPVLTGGAPKLVHHGKANCVEFTDDLLDQVVERIVGWYDAVETVLIARKALRRATDR